MKIDIKPPNNYIGPYQIADIIFFWVEKYPDDESLHLRWDYRFHDRFGIWLANTWVRNFCQWIENKRKRNIKIRIDYHDTWSMDYTLAFIIHPMLTQLKKTKHGYPNTDPLDVPHIGEGTRENTYDFDSNAEQRWDWILDEMIWAFSQVIDDDAEDQFHSGVHDMQSKEIEVNGKKMYKMVKGPNDTHVFDAERWGAWYARKTNGFKLFGKYYDCLWD